MNTMSYRALGAALGAAASAAAASSAAQTPFPPAYLAVTWGDDAVHLLDGDMNPLGSFGIGGRNPNGVATDNSTIWTVTYGDRTVRGFDLAGQLQYAWSDAQLLNAQDMAYLGNGQILVFTFTGGQPRFVTYDAASGAVLDNVDLTTGTSSVEGIAVDTAGVWRLESAYLHLTDPATGADLRTIPNPAAGAPFEGTALANLGGGRLMVGASTGAWWEISALDGSVLDQGLNHLPMFGLARWGLADTAPFATAVPEGPAVLAGGSLALGLAAFAVARRRS